MSGHKSESSSCPAKEKECFGCHKLNHFGRCCRSSKNFSESSKVRSIINKISTCQQTGFKLCSLVLAGHNLSFIIDLGAKVSIINQETWRRLFHNYTLQPLQLSLPDTMGNQSRHWVRFYCLYSMKISQPVNFCFL